MLDDSFGAVNGVLLRYGLWLNEDVADKVTAIDDMAIEYQTEGRYFCWYEYNIETGELIQKDAADIAEGDELYGMQIYEEHGDLAVSLNQFCEGFGENVRNLTPSEETYSTTVSGKTVTFCTKAHEKVTAVRIKGTITMYE